MTQYNISFKQRSKKVACVFICILLTVTLSFPITKGNILKANATPLDDARSKLEAIQPEVNEKSNAYVEALNAQQAAQEKVNEANERIDYCNQEIPKNQAKLAVVCKKMYRGNNDGGLLDIILGSDSLVDLFNNLKMFSIINNKITQTIIESQNLKKELETQLVSLEENLRIATEKADEALAAKIEVENVLSSIQEEIKLVEEQTRQELERAKSEGGGGGSHSGGPAPYLGDVVATAMACKGHWYQYGAAGPDVFDCSGLVCWCYGCGGSHPWTTNTFVGCSDGWFSISASEAVPGDVVSSSGHAGIYIGGGRMIHAPCTGDVVKESSVQGGMGYYRHG